VRIVVEDFREDVTKNKKDGTRGRLRIDDGDRHVANNPTAAITWLWKFILCRAAGYAESACSGPRFACSAGWGR
jgi:hypothetical protein